MQGLFMGALVIGYNGDCAIFTDQFHRIRDRVRVRADTIEGTRSAFHYALED